MRHPSRLFFLLDLSLTRYWSMDGVTKSLNRVRIRLDSEAAYVDHNLSKRAYPRSLTQNADY
jgi:hypothetical protein